MWLIMKGVYSNVYILMCDSVLDSNLPVCVLIVFTVVEF